jgi:hypothetical protein
VEESVTVEVFTEMLSAEHEEAVLAERERCAKIAERHVWALDGPGEGPAKIAAAIRRGE